MLHRDGEKEWERERAAAPPLFKCKYLTGAVNRYTINMDPLKGGRCLNVALGGQKVTGSNLKKQCWSFRSALIEFSFLREPSPHKPMLSATACLYLIVSHYQLLWHLLLFCLFSIRMVQSLFCFGAFWKPACVLTRLRTKRYVAQAGPFSVGRKSQNDHEISVHVLQIMNLRVTAY